MPTKVEASPRCLGEVYPGSVDWQNASTPVQEEYSALPMGTVDCKQVPQDGHSPRRVPALDSGT